MKRYLSLILLILIFVIACSSTSKTNEPIETQPPVAFSTATKSSATIIPNNPTSEPGTSTLESEPTFIVESPGDLIWSDDFSEPNSGWDIAESVDKIVNYFNGGFRMWLDKSQYDIWTNAGQFFSGPVIVEVDATKTGGPDDNDFGVICDYQDTDNFHVGLISSDGYTVIAKLEDQTWEYLSSEKMISVDSINQGEVTNHIRFDCFSGELTLYANGSLIANVFDNTFTGGDVGLIVGTFDLGGVDIQFDNFEVREP